MRLRRLCAAATAFAAVLTVAGCRTNVDVAATIDGQQVSETQLTSYLTSAAKPVELGSSSASHAVAPRPFVLTVLIERKFFLALLAATPAGRPTQRQVDALVTSYINGTTLDAAVAKLGVHGYTDDFDRMVVEVQEFYTVLSTESQRGVDVRKAYDKIVFPVSVNPRYGSWDAANKTLDTGANAGVPGFLTLQPTAVAGSTGLGS